MHAPVPPPLPVARPGWWRRHWRWAAPVLVLAVLLFLAAGIASFAFGVMATMKSSGAYRHAMEIARADPVLADALGRPVSAAWYFSGSIHNENGRSRATLGIPLEGPRGSAHLQVEGTGRDCSWTFQVLEARIDADGRVIDLRRDAGTQVAADDSRRKSGANRKGD
ncbi:cytochrome c oxidase assembly factor Coa1 family protein [Pseudoxanthomonas sp.]|uniref:cytochrome c oxidase assembly factor Coa1 family protein n=1 Tax=Pseudoxanthomonas sp. TaxID=1871049 RepID=UPI00258C6C6F|nr:cytochrome c oxidase assembly factor Coa1 family protein [Pseudoxanthomonas sp.]MCR6687711.1 cytochrome c oxidase assembly factor 1 family protein [Pseudoxanthomonas sp.]